MRQSLIIHRNAGFVPLNLIGGKGKGIALFKRYLAVFKGFNAVFRSFCVKHYRYGQPQLFAHLFNKRNSLFVVGVRVVRKIKPRNIHTRLAHLNKRLLIRAGRTQRTYYFRFSHNSSPVSSL